MKRGEQRMSDRHEKWVRVEPGTVIPAGQPYRWEWHDGAGTAAEERTAPPQGKTFSTSTGIERFIDSTWKPPLVLPTEPTWGIAVAGHKAYCYLGKWLFSPESNIFTGTGPNDHVTDPRQFARVYVLDFIPLTDEQVARIEAAR